MYLCKINVLKIKYIIQYKSLKEDDIKIFDENNITKDDSKV